MASELDDVADRIASEFDLIAKRIPESEGEPEKIMLYRVNIDDIVNPNVNTPDQVAVYLALVLARTKTGEKQFIEVVGENSYAYKEEVMGLPGFTKKMGAFLGELGFKKEEYPIEGLADFGIAQSYGFWKKEIEVKVPIPKVRTG